MASKTLLQTRTDYPAVTPIDPDECLILDQQTDQPEGKQSTAATLSELIATGGRVVETDEAYKTLYADSVVNVSASDITITVGSVMRVGSRLLIRRTASYDGDPVTISPPSGATFEGKSSISLYGQYSFVELERISSTVFAIMVWPSDLMTATLTPVSGYFSGIKGEYYIKYIGDQIRIRFSFSFAARTLTAGDKLFDITKGPKIVTKTVRSIIDVDTTAVRTSAILNICLNSDGTGEIKIYPTGDRALSGGTIENATGIYGDATVYL